MHDANGSFRTTGQRSTSTRAWIVTAFNRLVLGRRYESLSVGELSRRAGVGRSTFYEHFRDKEDVLRHALTPILVPLADAAVGAGDVRKVRFVLDHIAENRARTLDLLKDETRAHIERALAELILARLGDAGGSDAATRKLAAAGMAGAQIAVMLAWLLEGAKACSSEQAAAIVVKSTIRDKF